MLGVDSVALGQPLELVVDAPEIGEHATRPQRGQLGERKDGVLISVPPRVATVTSASRTALRAEAEAPDHAEQRGVGLVDRLATHVDVEAPIERDAGIAAVQRVHPTADALARLEHEHVPAGIAQVDRGGEPGEARADDDDSPGRSGIGTVGNTRHGHDPFTLRAAPVLSAKLTRCATDECRSRSSRPNSSGYDTITNNLSESSVADRRLRDLGIELASNGAAGSTSCCSATATTSATRRCARRSPPAARVCAPTTCSSPRARRRRCSATATSLLEPGDHAVVVRTNYATNLETPRAIGADLDIVDLTFEDGWQPRRRRGSRRACGRASRGLISVTCPHNPTGTMLDLASLHALVELAERSGAVLLVDETYRDLTHARRRCRSPPRCRRARSACRRCRRPTGCPGLRVGWAVCRDPDLAETLLAAKEQMFICGATLDEAIAGTRARRPRRGSCRRSSTTSATGSGIVREWMAGQDTFEWIEPAGGVVGLVRFRPEVAVDTDRFYERPARASTAPTSGRATGSRSTTATSGSASAGPPKASCAPASPRSPPPPKE